MYFQKINSNKTQTIGPGNEYFTKIERHSDIKYNLKGVERVKGSPSGDNDSNFMEEKEGNETYAVKGYKVKDDETSLEWKGGKCAKNKCIGRVSINENFVTFFPI